MKASSTKDLTDVPVVLLTRFAVSVEGRREYLNPEWFAGRQQILARTLLPSVEHQTFGNFRWLLMVGDDVSKSCVRRLQAFVQPFGEVLICNHGESLDVAVTRYLGFPGTLISCRVDSDDSLAPDFIESVVSQIRPGEALAFFTGAGYSLRNSRAWFVFETANPFMSLYSESGQSIWTIGDHNLVHRKENFRLIVNAKPLWLKVIHGGNIANSSEGTYIPMSSRFFTTHFPHLEWHFDSEATNWRRALVAFLSPVFWAKIFRELGAYVLSWFLPAK